MLETMHKNILFVVPHLGRSGPTKQLSYLANELVSQGYKITILTLLPEKQNNLQKLFDQTSIQLKLCSTQNFLLRWLQFFYLINSKNIHIVHSQGLIPDLFCAVGGVKRKWVSVARNFPPDDYPTKFGAIKGKLFVKLHLFSHRKCRYLVACSESLSRAYADINILSKSIQNAVGQSAKPNIKHNSMNKKQYVFVGNLIPRKNVANMCLLFQQIARNGEKLHIVGGGTELESLKNRFLTDKKIVFHGAKMDVSPFLHTADILLNFSKSEGLPNAVLEGLAAGCICVLSDIEPHKELQSYIGEGVVTITIPDKLDEKNIEELSEELIQTLKGIPAEQALINKQRVEDCFGVKRLAQQFQSHYNSIQGK